MKNPARNSYLVDMLFLMSVVIASTLSYVTGLGFYSDDWSYHSLLAQASPHGLISMFRTLFVNDADIRVRPVQAAYLVFGSKAFGLNPIRWHIADQVILAFAVATLYLATREVLDNRPLALSVALVFGVMPHYSTDRIWVTMAAGFCVMFGYFGIFALAKSVSRTPKHPAAWLLVSVVAMILSVLSYEVELGLMVVSILVAGYYAYRKDPASSISAWDRGTIRVLSVGIALFTVLLAKLCLQIRVGYHHHFFSRFWQLLAHAASQAFRFSLWTYFLRLPVFLTLLYRHAALSGRAIVIALLITAAVALYLSKAVDPALILRPRTCVFVLVAGVALFALGYGLFLADPHTDFTTMGLANRITIASAHGAACVMVSLVGLLCTALKGSVQRGAFAAAIAALCGASCLAMSGIGHFWVDGAQKQNEIVHSVQQNVHALPHGAVLLIGGVCRYTGPAVVFEGVETATPLQFAFGDFSLRANVISPNMHFHPLSVDTTMYGQPDASYPYGENLYVYDVPRRQLTVLASQATALAYLRQGGQSAESACPVAHEGDGAALD